MLTLALYKLRNNEWRAKRHVLKSLENRMGIKKITEAPSRGHSNKQINSFAKRD